MNIDWSKAPEDATHYLPEGEQFFACWIKPGFSMREERQGSWVEDEDESASHLYVARPSCWTGKGLPPVGTVCEFNSCWAHISKGESWHQVTVVYSSDESYVVRRDGAPEGETTEVCGPATLSEIARFRPIRTAEQIAAEERDQAVEEMMSLATCRGTLTDLCRELYDAGYRKQEAAH